MHPERYQLKMILMYQWLSLALLCLTVLCQTLRANSQGPMSIPDLEVYLRSPSNDPKVCNQRSEGRYPVVFTAESAGEWLSAFITDVVPYERWQLCTKELLASLPPEEVAHLLDAMGTSYLTLIKRPEFEVNPLIRMKTFTLNTLYLDHKPQIRYYLSRTSQLAKEIKGAMTTHRLGFRAKIAAGMWIEDYKTKLKRFNEIDLNANRIVRTWLRKDFTESHGVIVRQLMSNVPPMTLVNFFKYKGTDREVVTAIDLTDALFFEVEDLDQRVSLCSSLTVTESLEPTPCISLEDVVIEHPLAKLHADGTLSLAGRLTATQFTQFAKTKDGLVLPIRIGGKRWLTLSWNPYIQPPSDLVLTAQGNGNNGPTLWILIDHRDLSRFLISVVYMGKTIRILLDLADAVRFQIVSKGAPGASGERVFDEGKGGRGGKNGMGGRGGNGGMIYVDMICGDADCSHTRMVAQNMILSLGGRGGPGVSVCTPSVSSSDDENFWCLPVADGEPGVQGRIKFDVIPPGAARTYEE